MLVVLGQQYLMREPVGNSLNDNLIRELVRSTALTPKDLDLLGE